jgi:hypothetical protein
MRRRRAKVGADSALHCSRQIFAPAHWLLASASAYLASADVSVAKATEASSCAMDTLGSST